MAVTLGDNSGFVTTAPTADPAGANFTIDNQCMAWKLVVPEGCTQITEMGWYCDNATQAGNYELGLYSHNATYDEPENQSWASGNLAKGTDAGWKVASGLSVAVTAAATVWLALQVDNVSTATYANRGTAGDARYSYLSTGRTALPSPWPLGASSTENITSTPALYALWASGGGGIVIPVLMHQYRQRRS